MCLIKTIGYEFMTHLFKMIWLLIALVLLMPMRQVFAIPSAPMSDIRILIDVSGSMKKNDPNNLRVPALRLIVGLLPNDIKAGTWTFGKYVNMLVPFREVNDAWKLEAELQSKNINSHGLFTNIEQALNKATANQKGVDARYRRSVILLSDGLVDISRDEAVNKKSRQRILDVIVPRLKNNNVAVHTIALSESADHKLLRAISLATDGGYKQVDNADQLQRVFLHLFEKATTRDTVPLVDNEFRIDSSVSEMTLLVFRRKGSQLTELLLPDQSRISQKELPNNVRWHSEGNYDLITIDKPLVGQWLINADIDPDNRVMVVTDLKLTTTDLPNNILIGETFDFDVNLTDKNKLIVRQDFLKLVDAQLKLESEVTDASDRSLNAKQKKGVYRTQVGDNFQPGRNDVVITMTSDTFERQRRQSINVVETPFDITVDQLREEATRTHRLTLRPDEDLIKTDMLSIAAMLTAEDGSEWSYEVMKVADKEWQLTLADLRVGEKYTVALQIRAETIKGRALFLQPALIELEDAQVASQVDTQKELIKPETNTAELAKEQLEQASMTDDVGQEQTPVIEEVEQEIIEEIVQQTVVEPILDEMGQNLDDLLPEVTTDVASLIGVTDEVDEINDGEGLTPAIKLAIGNGLILLLIGLGVFFWRRKSATSTNPGEQL
jgi:uncharacterized protein (TIGR03503 family)